MSFWNGKKVLITGHTGFKGSWLSLWLQMKGACVAGYALNPPTEPNLFTLSGISEGMTSIIGDIKDERKLADTVKQYKPEIIFHLAAQPLVRASYEDPLDTFAVNIMGTVHLLNAVRLYGSTKVILNITTDKCYENVGWEWPYRESDPLGGHDPYSSSKACSEIVTKAYRQSFLHDAGVQVATARAGNVIGGGDWAEDRLVPDLVRSLMQGHTPVLRNPYAVRPWQHVLEPLHGYMMLAQRMYTEKGRYDDAWNFGPSVDQNITVQQLTEALLAAWNGRSLFWQHEHSEQPHEAQTLRLDSSKAHVRLGWRPKWNTSDTVQMTIDWYKRWSEGADMKDVSKMQILAYEKNRS